MDILPFIAASLLGYLIGSIPNGVFIARFYDADPRDVGSGRTGGTNVYRTAGPAAGVITALLDSFKGIVAVLAAQYLFPDLVLTASLAGLLAIVGHNWSIFLKFGGGAGTMTNLGALLTLSPLTFVLAGLTGLAALVTSRIASVGSLSVAWAALIVFVVRGFLGQSPPELIVYGVGEALIITWSLRPNIQRLLAGNERRIGGNS